MVRIQGKCAEARRICANLEALFNVAWPAAIAPPGHPADPEALVYVAEKIAAVYKSALEWKLDFERIEEPDGFDRLKSIASSLCDNMVSEIEEYSSKLRVLTNDAVCAARLGQKAEVALTLKLTVPDLTGYEEELARVTALFESGDLSWE